MSSIFSRPMGWTPRVDEDYKVGGPIYTHRSYSPASSTSSLSEMSHNSPRFSSRRHHDPEWVARPRNAFIIFRCEYSRLHSRHGRRIRRPPGSSVEPTLSKRAAVAWGQMSGEAKEPYKIRAEEERNDHARRYPTYRFRPQRRAGARRYKTRSFKPTPLTYQSPETTPEPISPFTSAIGNLSLLRLSPSDTEAGTPEAIHIQDSSPISVNLISPLGWESDPSVLGEPNDCGPPADAEVTFHSFAQLPIIPYTVPLDFSIQYHEATGTWPQFTQSVPASPTDSFEFGAEQTYQGMSPYGDAGTLPVISTYTTLGDANTYPSVATVGSGEYFGNL